jgi:GT2 family glycosyltransferase
MFKASDVSVVIPSFNSYKTILACLESLMAQTAAPYEIIVVDSSTDDTPHLIRQHFPQVHLKYVAQQMFPGPARNLGVELAEGLIVAFIDADCIAVPDWVQRIAETHDNQHLVVGGSVDVGNPSSVVAWAGQMFEFREFLPSETARYVAHIPTCNISYRRALLSVYGGFPNAYYPQEDLLFNYMLVQAGVKIWFDPQIGVRHFCREGLHEFLSHQHRIGRVTRCTLQRIPMHGSSIARRGKLSWLSSPALGLLKFWRNSKSLATSYPRAALRHPGIFPVLLLGSIWWTRGFAASVTTGLKGIRGWDDPNEPIFAAFANRDLAPDRK